MYRMAWIVAVLVTALSIGTLAHAGEAELIAEADRLYGLRADADRANEALEALRAATTEFPDSYGLQWRLARACWWIAEEGSEEIKKSLGKEGWDAGERAVAINASGIEGHYWATLACGEYSKGISILKALAQGIDKTFTTHLELVLAADEDYDNGGALRAKGKYWSSLPRLMRSFPKSLEKLERSDELVPNHPRTLYYLGELHHLMGDDDTARGYLDASLAASSWPDAAERARVSGWARSLRSKLD